MVKKTLYGLGCTKHDLLKEISHNILLSQSACLNFCQVKRPLCPAPIVTDTSEVLSSSNSLPNLNRRWAFSLKGAAVVTPSVFLAESQASSARVVGYFKLTLCLDGWIFGKMEKFEEKMKKGIF